MKLFKPLCALALMTFVFEATACNVPIERTFAVSVQTIPGAMIPAGTTVEPVTLTLSAATGSVSIPLNQATYVQKFALRSVLNDPADQTDDALQNDSLVNQCPKGRALLDFITNVTVKIRHQNQSDDQAVTIAIYDQSPGTHPCGIRLTPQGVDIGPYLEDYAFVTTLTGLPPATDTLIGGYVGVKAEEGLF